ncbi:DNA polymerase III subunit delta' [uncultured Actinomyces sp.]|uniref:DNA polymerase III subunit delta' n=1 Tax=uncultured Actinomyces sp. TaxID=249061 RepID=UPI00288B1F99|nr:DNA polymerase III subunit delta' [uncultured Actinomyces sp.]
MSVWTDVVGQERAVAVLDAAARSARALVRARRAGSAAGSGAGPDVAAELDVGPGAAGSDVGGAGTARSGTGAAGPGTGAASADAEPESGQEPDADASAMTHAWLITGPPGSGRSNAARAFAAALQCTGKVPGCGRCKPCRDVMAGSHPDVVRLATDKLLITMDEVKELIGQAQRRPWTGSWRVILVEDADRMAERTTNVLLKSIEEPPPQTVWLLCTPSADDVLPTIRSRCRLVTLRIPPADAVAELLVRRDGADPEVAARAARASQSHIGLARHLAKDPGAWERRRRLLLAPVSLRSVGDAVLAAADLVEAAEAEAKETTAERDAAERTALLRTLGLEGDARIPPALRAQVRQLEEDQKRRARRARTDVLDRAMIDLLSFYRDVLVSQMGSDVERVNIDLTEALDRVAATTGPEQSLARIAAIEQCRARLRSNASPLLAVESLMVQLRPQARAVPNP